MQSEEKSAFADFEDAVWKNLSEKAFVGSGYVEANVAGRDSDRAPYLQFFLRQSRRLSQISTKKAKELIESSTDWNTRRTLRKDLAVCELAEEMAEKFSKTAASGDDCAAWPFLANSEKDQWRALARWTLDRFNPGVETASEVLKEGA